MPQLQTFDFTPTPRQPTMLERTLSGVADAYTKQRDENVENDAIRNIFEQSRQEGRDLDSTLEQFITQRGISPTKRVMGVNTVLEMRKQNATVQKEIQKRMAEDQEAELTQKFLSNPEIDNQSPTELYKSAVDFGFKPKTATALANQQRLRFKEDRMSATSINSLYNPELKLKMDEIKNEFDLDKKKALVDEYEALKEMKQQDLRDFKDKPKYVPRILRSRQEPEATPQIQSSTVEPQAPDVMQPQTPEEQQMAEAFTQVAEALARGYPPEEHKGEPMFLKANRSPDGKQHEFKSDGKQWVLVK